MSHLPILPFLQQAQLLCKDVKIPLQQVKGAVHGRLSRNDDDVKSAFQAGLVESIGLADAAACPVALHGAAQFDRNGDTQVVHRLVPALHHVHHHALASGRLAPVVQCAEQMIFLKRKVLFHNFHPLLKFKTAKLRS